MPKRKNSSIKEYALKSGKKRYEFTVSLGKNSNGNRVLVHRRGFKSYSDAETVFNRIIQNKPDDYIKQKQIKIADLYPIWFDYYKTDVKESTANKTISNYENHIKPYFGNNFIDQISVASIQLWANKLAKNLVRYRVIIGILRSMYEYAMRLGYVKDNPVLKILIPKRTTRKRRNIEENVYTQEELEAFLETAKKVSERVYAYFKLLSSTGMRRSEALALTWNDIDFINNTINIDKTLAYGFNNRLIVSKPKTKNSKRIIPLSETLKETLLTYRKSEKIVSNKIFHTITGNYVALSKPMQWLNEVYSLDHQENINYATKYGIPNPELYADQRDIKHITVHGFRHTFATLLIENTDVKPKTVQMLLGHSDIRITLDIYTHITKKNQDDAINAMKRLNL